MIAYSAEEVTVQLMLREKLPEPNEIIHSQYELVKMPNQDQGMPSTTNGHLVCGSLDTRNRKKCLHKLLVEVE